MKRKYSPEEVERIFARAAEMELTTPSTDRALTLSELLDTAEQAGIDSDLVVAATQELEGVTSTPSHPFIGGYKHLSHSTSLDIDPASFDLKDVASELNRSFGQIGRSDISKSTLNWHAEGTEKGTKKVRAVATENDGRLTISVNESLVRLRQQIMAGVTMGGGSSLMALTFVYALQNYGTSGAMVSVLLSFFVAFAVARTAYQYASNKRNDELQNATIRLHTTLAAQYDEPLEGTQVELSGFDDETDSEGADDAESVEISQHETTKSQS